MASLIASDRALQILAALEQRDGLRLSELAAILRISVSSVQKALSILIGDRLVTPDPGAGRRYRLAEGEDDTVRCLLGYGARRSTVGLLDVALRANPAVEFAGRDASGMVIVIRWDAAPVDEVRLVTGVDRFRGVVALETLRHEAVQDRLRDDPELVARIARLQVIVGSVERSFPDPSRRGSPDSPPLGHLHPSLRRPSRARLARVARSHGLSEIRVFGSAVRSDFRPDSDVDIVVRRGPGTQRTLVEQAHLTRELEDLFQRSVDVLDADLLRPDVRKHADAEGITLYG